MSGPAPSSIWTLQFDRSSAVVTGALGAHSLVAAAGGARALQSSSALLALFMRGAERRKTQGLARPLEPLRTARHACEACLGPLAIGDPRLSALHHGVRETLPHYLGPSFAARSLPATGGPAGSLRTGHSAHRAVSEASRESGRLSRTRRHTVPASAKQEPSGMAPLNKQDE